MYKKLLIVGALCCGMTPVFAQSTINKCTNGSAIFIYTEFDCPEGYELVTEGWLSETNITKAEQFGNTEPLADEYSHRRMKNSPTSQQQDGQIQPQ